MFEMLWIFRIYKMTIAACRIEYINYWISILIKNEFKFSIEKHSLEAWEMHVTEMWEEFSQNHISIKPSLH